MIICFTDFAASALTFLACQELFCMCGCDLHCKPIIVGLHSCWWRGGSSDLSASNVEKQPGRNLGHWSCGNRSHEEIAREHHQPAEGKTGAFTPCSKLQGADVSHWRSSVWCISTAFIYIASMLLFYSVLNWGQSSVWDFKIGRCWRTLKIRDLELWDC